jgi:hypothetical protein
VARGGIEPPTQGFSTLIFIVFDSRNTADPCRHFPYPIGTKTISFDWNGLERSDLDRIQASKPICRDKKSNFYDFYDFKANIVKEDTTILKIYNKKSKHLT